MAPVLRTPGYVGASHLGFLGSLSVDRQLARYDIAGSVAHVEMLERVGLVPAPEAELLASGLRRIAREVRDGSFPWREELEDVHTNVEVRLTELVGAIGGKLHTGRSRNDQIALDERLFLRAEIHALGVELVALLNALLARAEREATLAAPGYTHLQRAQPITLGHYWLAHASRFERDLDRLLATATRAEVSPLGAGALAGSTLPIDPAWTAERLGFVRPFTNSIDAVSDRDELAELLFDIALMLTHASTFGEEVVVYATPEFGLLDRSNALGEGSSQMPHKRNPDVAELIRGKAARGIGDLVTLLTLLKGLPLAYDRDLQEDKPPVLDALATAHAVLGEVRGLVDSLRFDEARLAKVMQDPGLYSTDRAEELVRTGIDFRSAHERVRASGREGHDASRGADTAADPPTPALDALTRRASPGGPSPASVRQQLADLRERLAALQTSLSSLGRKVERVEELLNQGDR